MNPETPAAVLLTKFTALTILVISIISIFAFWAVRRIIAATSTAGKIREDDGNETKKRNELLAKLEKMAASKENEDTGQ